MMGTMIFRYSKFILTQNHLEEKEENGDGATHSIN